MMRKTYFIVLGLNYLVGFGMSLVFTFSYSGYASSLFFVKQVVSSVLCLIFITIPIESALVNRLSEFQIATSRRGLLLAAGAIIGPYFYSSIVSGEWGLSTAIIVGGSIAQLGVSILSANSIRHNKIWIAAIFNIAGRLNDLIPISLIEYNLASSASITVFYFFCGFCVWFVIWKAGRPKILASTYNSSTSFRLVAMLLEVIVIGHLATLGADYKYILFLNSILTAALGLIVVPNLVKVGSHKKLIGLTLFPLLFISTFHFSSALVILRLCAFYYAYFSIALLPLVFVAAATCLMINAQHLTLYVIVSYLTYGLSTALWAHSYKLMQTIK